MKTAVHAVLVCCFFPFSLWSQQKWFRAPISSSLFLSSPRCILNKTTRRHRPLRYPVVPLCTLPRLPPRKLPALPARLLMLSCSTNLISTEHCWLDVMKLKYGPQNIKTVVPANQPKNQPFWNKCSVWVCLKYARVCHWAASRERSLLTQTETADVKVCTQLVKLISHVPLWQDKIWLTV